MKINADFDQRVLVHSTDLKWQTSPMEGVHRRPLDRVGGEVARATSIVRYAPGSHFSPHVHTGGEEFLVLEGVFQDEHGDYPQGTYVRNPPETRHKPGADKGCVLFVKLWQFQPDDRNQFSINIEDAEVIELQGVNMAQLHQDKFESVHIVKVKANGTFFVDAPGGAELLMLAGEFHEQGDKLTKYSWLRVAINSEIDGVAGPEGASFWLKSGHLAQVDSEIERVTAAQ